ncbi:MAG: HD domain-containing protein [Oligoflexia bacterium]|nr:HD domain-containing protein [Oligoflexia bacterium]
MKILHVEHEELIRELYALDIEGKDKWEILGASSIKEAVNVIQKEKDIKIIISGHKFIDGNSDQLYLFTKKFNKTIVFIHNSSFEGEIDDIIDFKNFKIDNPLNQIILKPNEGHSIVKAIENIITQQESQIKNKSNSPLLSATDPSISISTIRDNTIPSIQSLTLQVSTHKDESLYRKIGIKRFLRMNSVSSEVYLKLGEEKFVKVINDNEPYDTERISKYINKGVSYLYILKTQIDSFTSNYSKLLKSSLVKANIPLNERLEIQGDLLHLAQERAKIVGIDKEVIENMTIATNSVVNTVYQNYDLFTLLSTMMKKQDYLVEHSLTTALIAGNLATELGWETETTLQKLGLASMLHDVYLDKEHLAAISNKNTTAFNMLTDEEKEKILTHPFNTASHIDQSPNVLPDVSSIVFAHHEQPDGNGFPLAINAIRIPQITCTFIIAEDLANTLYYNKVNNEFIEDLIFKYKEKYSKGNFRIPLEALIEILEKNTFD